MAPLSAPTSIRNGPRCLVNQPCWQKIANCLVSIMGVFLATDRPVTTNQEAQRPSWPVLRSRHCSINPYCAPYSVRRTIKATADQGLRLWANGRRRSITEKNIWPTRSSALDVSNCGPWVFIDDAQADVAFQGRHKR